MHTDMGYWRKQGTKNTSICSKDSGEAAFSNENMTEKAVCIQALWIEKSIVYSPE